jgi:hypothetical protein
VIKLRALAKTQAGRKQILKKLERELDFLNENIGELVE